MINSKPALSGSYEKLRITLEEDGHMYAGGHGGWNNRAGKQYVPYGRRIFGHYIHKGFGGVPSPVDPESKIGKAFFWCSVPSGTSKMITTVWNPSKEPLGIRIGVNNSPVSVETIMPNEYKNIKTIVGKDDKELKIDLEGDRRLVVLETAFE
jgi:hypothetical protein